MRSPYALGGGDEVRRHVDGSRSATTRTGRRPSSPRSAAAIRRIAAACGTAASCRRTRCKMLRDERGGYVEIDESSSMDWAPLRARIARARHAQLELRSHRADRDDLEHHRRWRVDRARLPEHLREVEPVGRVHRRQRASGPGPEETEPLGRRDGVGPQVLRRLAREDRPRAGRRCARSYATGVRESTPRGSSRPARGARSGSTRRRASTSTWRAPRARSSTRHTSSRGCAASKTTYYLRTLAATSAEKSTGQGGELNAVSESGALPAISAKGRARPAAVAVPEPKFCAIDDPTCEACQYKAPTCKALQ